MPIDATPLVSRLQLRLVTGLDENSNPILRTRSYSNIKTDATNVNLHALAEEIGALQVHTLSAVRRVDEFELEEV